MSKTNPQVNPSFVAIILFLELEVTTPFSPYPDTCDGNFGGKGETVGK